VNPKPTQIPGDGRIDLTEDELSKSVPPSALPWARAGEFVQLPADVKGLAVLDVGAGASDITAILMERGADAYAIDPKYRKKSEINDMIKAHLRSGQYDMPTRMTINQTLLKWTASIAKTPDRYKATSATHLPFADNFFDIVFSIDTLTAFLDVDRGILMQSVQECLRVTKPGGRVTFSPFQDIQPIWPPAINALRLRNDEHLLNWLKTNPDVESVEVRNTPVKFHHALSFKKRAA
jgi:ubiquinone/menaquinone biosynthesis C-methylase UbiE